MPILEIDLGTPNKEEVTLPTPEACQDKPWHNVACKPIAYTVYAFSWSDFETLFLRVVNCCRAQIRTENPFSLQIEMAWPFCLTGNTTMLVIVSNCPGWEYHLRSAEHIWGYTINWSANHSKAALQND